MVVVRWHTRSVWSAGAGEGLPRALHESTVAGGVGRIPWGDVMGSRELVRESAWARGQVSEVAGEGTSEVGVGGGDEVTRAVVGLVVLAVGWTLTLLVRALSKAWGRHREGIEGCWSNI